jgi:hypothetical protein
LVHRKYTRAYTIGGIYSFHTCIEVVDLSSPSFACFSDGVWYKVVETFRLEINNKHTTVYTNCHTHTYGGSPQHSMHITV